MDDLPRNRRFEVPIADALPIAKKFVHISADVIGSQPVVAREQIAPLKSSGPIGEEPRPVRNTLAIEFRESAACRNVARIQPGGIGLEHQMASGRDPFA